MRNLSLESFAEKQEWRILEVRMTRKVRGTEPLEHLKDRAIKDDKFKREERLLKKRNVNYKWSNKAL